MANELNPSVIIEFFVALGTCGAVLVALYSKKQSTFESTFSLLLSQHNQALKEIKSSSDYAIFTNEILDGLKSLDSQNKLMHNKYDYFYGSYFRILYHLIKYIDEQGGKTCCSNKKKKIYTSLVRAHLDNELIFLLAINCAHGSEENQYDKYKKLIEKYALLEHLILKKEILFRYGKSNADSIYEKNLAIKLIDHKELIFYDIIATYKKEAFGTNPNVSDFKSK
ncbi:TPA: putative phage abortive infection protein [Providencia alcalifaciens]